MTGYIYKLDNSSQGVNKGWFVEYFTNALEMECLPVNECNIKEIEECYNLGYPMQGKEIEFDIFEKTAIILDSYYKLNTNV